MYLVLYARNVFKCRKTYQPGLMLLKDRSIDGNGDQTLT